MTFSPFKNESDAVTLGDLKIENREDHIAIYGRLALTRDRAGLDASPKATLWAALRRAKPEDFFKGRRCEAAGNWRSR